MLVFIHSFDEFEPLMLPLYYGSIPFEFSSDFGVFIFYFRKGIIVITIKITATVVLAFDCFKFAHFHVLIELFFSDASFKLNCTE